MLNRCLRLGPLVAGIALGGLSCSSGGLSISFRDHPPRHVTHVYVPTEHVCHRGCHEHYWNEGRIVVLAGHRHGPGCGHHWSGSHWIVVKKAKRIRGHREKVIKVKHVHSASCGCVYNRHGQKWVKIRKGHIHGPRCGHIFIDGHWSIRH